MNRAQYLQELGITPYVFRHRSNQNIPYLTFLIHPNESQHPLLQKIIDATALPSEAIAIYSSDNLPSQVKHMIAFGKNLTTNGQSINTVSLNELATNDGAKRALWQQLKSLKAAYEQ